MLKVGQRFAVERKRRESRGFVCRGLLLQRLKMRGNGRENLVGRLSAVGLRGRERAEQRTILALTVSHVTRHTSHVTSHTSHVIGTILVLTVFSLPASSNSLRTGTLSVANTLSTRTHQRQRHQRRKSARCGT
jgi:hypothetical protein